MGLFDSSEKKISDREFREIASKLRTDHSWSDSRIKQVESAFLGDLGEEGAQRGIDKKEAAKRLDYLREHKSKYGLEDRHLDTLHQEFGKHLDLDA